MTRLTEIRLPAMPECWESCGACGDDEVLVSEILVSPGDQVQFDDPLITLETDKTTLDIPSPYSGEVVDLHIAVGDPIGQGDLIIRLRRG
jgi:pyruvate/2-oxoglutarate dehydrogenase complex dihydrolipoamide acyltransferase (E2) component